ncbi:MAG: hypothetical protein GY862_18885, partial [Gammaproteobacteria bacterium]|nr:hypothetical protein [Gammaproteobacteria bacterium]
LNGNGHNGNGRAAADHLEQQEIFDAQSPELQEFMMQTAVLPEAEKLPRFCNALLDIDDAKAHLQAMIDNNLLGDLDFAEFLREKVKQDPDAYRKLRLKTAKTLEHARPKEAIGPYVEAQAWQKATELLEDYGQEFYDRGRALELYGWLEQIPESDLTRYPRLLLLKGRILKDDLGKPKKALELFCQAERLFQQQGNFMGKIRAWVWQSAG